MKAKEEPSQVKLIEETIVWKGFLTVKKALLCFEKFDRTMTKPVTRESITREDAVAAILWDPDTLDTLLVKQFRYPTFGKGPGWGVECAAGRMEAGETPLQTMEREIREETGYKADQLHQIMTFYSSPGISDERIFLFSGWIHKQPGEKPFYGDKDMMEDIQLVWFRHSEIKTMLKPPLIRTELQDAKTLIGLYWWLNQIEAVSKI